MVGEALHFSSDTESVILSPDKLTLIEKIDKKLQTLETDLQNTEHYLPGFLSKSPKADFWHDWADLLEEKYKIAGTPELISEITNTLRHRLISLNKESMVGWMYDVLPFKYKYHKSNPVDFYVELKKSGSPNINYELENKPYIDMLDNHIMACITIKKKLETTQFLTKKDEQGKLLLDPNRMKSDITTLKAADDFALDVWDNRMDVSIYTQHYLIAMVLRYNIGHATGAYLGFIKDFGAKAMKKSITILDNLLSPKQVGKIMRGLTKELHGRYDPKNKKEAQLTGFWGDQCVCESWRVTYETIYNETTETLSRKLKCHKCNETWKPQLEVLPSARPGIIIDAEETV